MLRSSTQKTAEPHGPAGFGKSPKQVQAGEPKAFQGRLSQASASPRPFLDFWYVLVRSRLLRGTQAQHKVFRVRVKVCWGSCFGNLLGTASPAAQRRVCLQSSYIQCSHVYTYVYTCMAYLSLSTCIYICICVPTSVIRTYIHGHMGIFICMFSMYIHTYDVYCMHVYTYIYIYIHVYMYIQLALSLSLFCCGRS